MKIGELCSYEPKSTIRAGEAVIDAEYMFFTSSSDENKRYIDYQFDGERIIMGTGGKASLHYYFGKFATSTDCVVLHPDERVRCKYLYYFFKANMSVLEAGFKGAGLKHTNKKYINEISIENIPSLEEQEEVIRIFDELQNIIDLRSKELLALDSLISSLFVNMFATPKDEWPLVSIADICSNARTGPFGSSLHHDEFVEEGIFVLGIDNAAENKFSYNKMRYITEEKYQQLKRYTVYPGDVIITIMGTVGRSAVIPFDIPTAINTKHLACLTPDVSEVDSYFLCKAFQIHPEIKRQLQCQSKGAIMDGLNLTVIKEVRFNLPPLVLQKKYVDIYVQVEKTKAVVQKALDKTQLLFDSLMQTYFR